MKPDYFIFHIHFCKAIIQQTENMLTKWKKRYVYRFEPSGDKLFLPIGMPHIAFGHALRADCDLNNIKIGKTLCVTAVDMALPKGRETVCHRVGIVLLFCKVHTSARVAAP